MHIMYLKQACSQINRLSCITQHSQQSHFSTTHSFLLKTSFGPRAGAKTKLSTNARHILSAVTGSLFTKLWLWEWNGTGTTWIDSSSQKNLVSRTICLRTQTHLSLQLFPSDKLCPKSLHLHAFPYENAKVFNIEHYTDFSWKESSPSQNLGWKQISKRVALSSRPET